jgi:hypothetical protein
MTTKVTWDYLDDGRWIEWDEQYERRVRSAAIRIIPVSIPVELWEEYEAAWAKLKELGERIESHRRTDDD